MRRLIRRAGNLTLMHGTSSKYYLSIITEGLLGKALTGNSSTSVRRASAHASEPYGVYLTNEKMTAELYAETTASAVGGKPIIVYVSVSDDDLGPDDMLEPDLYPELEEKDLDEITGLESLEVLSTCVHYGSIPPSQILKVEWLDGVDPYELVKSASEYLQDFLEEIEWRLRKLDDLDIDVYDLNNENSLVEYNETINLLNDELFLSYPLTIEYLGDEQFRYDGQVYTLAKFLDKIKVAIQDGVYPLPKGRFS